MPDKKTPASHGGTGPFGLFGSVLQAGLHGPRLSVPTIGSPDGKPPKPGPTTGTRPAQPVRDTRRPQVPRRNGG